MASTSKPKNTKEQQDDFHIEFSLYFTDLLVAWATTEQWFTAIFARLLRTDRVRADAILSSITSTRSRVDLVRRLSLMTVTHARKIRHFEKLCREFKSATELRNRLAHAAYHFKDSQSNLIGAVYGLTTINFLRPDFNGTNAYSSRRIDRGLFNEMRQMTRRCHGLSYRFRRFERAVEVLERPREQPAQLDKPRKPTAARRRRGARKRHSPRQLSFRELV